MLGALLAGLREASGWGGLKLTSVGGTATAITASVAAQGSITMAPTAYSTGMRFHLIPAASNTGATTLNVNSLGAKSIFLNGAALVGYELRISCPVVVEYDGTQFNLIGGAHGGDGIPLGTVRAFTGTTAPNGHLFCYGQAISRTTYADLFAITSDTYGVGDGSTTFNVPDLRGRVIAGQDDMGGSSANRLTGVTGSVNGDTLGGTGGAETHTLTSAQLAAHTHSVPALTVPTSTGSGLVGDGGFVLEVQEDTPSSVLTGTGTSGSTGSDSAHNNVQPTLILNYILKV
jgi:microcystin-dependent protein